MIWNIAVVNVIFKLIGKFVMVNATIMNAINQFLEYEYELHEGHLSNYTLLLKIHLLFIFRNYYACHVCNSDAKKWK